MRKRVGPVLAIVLAAAALLFTGYMAAFYTMLVGHWFKDHHEWAVYRYDSKEVRAFFEPARRIDRKLRPNRWGSD